MSDTHTSVFRVFHGVGDGVGGLFVDVYGAGATMIRYVEAGGRLPEPRELGGAVLEVLGAIGVQAVYDKPFIRDRSHGSGGDLAALTDPDPIAGQRLPESIVVDEPGGRFEVHLYDGFSTGLFLDQRANRGHVAQLCARLGEPSVCNLFAYTGAFSVACARAGARVSTVDVSPRYLRWARANFEHNGIDSTSHHFVRTDARAYLAFAHRKGLRFDLVILDPPTFGAADKRRKIPAWSSVRDYPKLLRLAREVLTPGGMMLASTNTTALCEAGALDRLIDNALGAGGSRLDLPPRQVDFPEGEQYPACELVRV